MDRDDQATSEIAETRGDEAAIDRREALAKMGRFSKYAAPVLVASMIPGKALAGSPI